jgi:hypothetical protein
MSSPLLTAVDVLAKVAAAGGIFLTLASLNNARKQLEAQRKTTMGDFLLRLDARFDKHYEVHLALRPGGKWSSPTFGPSNAAEWAPVEAYMGLFERVKVLIDNGVLDLGTFVRLYGYKLHNILANRIIVESKLERERESWSDFLALSAAVEEYGQEGSGT